MISFEDADCTMGRWFGIKLLSRGVLNIPLLIYGGVWIL